MSEAKKTHRKHSKEFKLQVLREAEDERATITSVCEKYNLSRSVFRNWKQRYNEQGVDGLEDRAPVPKKTPNEVPAEIQEKVAESKKNNMLLGSRKLKEHLERFEGIFLSVSTVNRILRRFGFKPADEIIQAEARKNDPEKESKYQEELELAQHEWERFCRNYPCELWQIDISTFFIRGCHRVWLVFVIDDHSRFIVNYGIFRQQTAENVLEVLRGAFIRYGLPGEILTDNGTQFTSWQGVTRFEKMLKKLDIHHTKARPQHPQTLGKIEAFNRNIKRELLDVELFRSQEEAAERIASYIEHYNYARTHQGIGGFTPADRFFGIAQEVERRLKEQKQQHKEEPIKSGHKPRLFLVGNIFDKPLRIQEEGGQVLVYWSGELVKKVDLSLKNLEI